MSWLKKNEKEDRKVTINAGDSKVSGMTPVVPASTPSPGTINFKDSTPRPTVIVEPPIAPPVVSPPAVEKQSTKIVENVRSVLSEGTVINGRLTFDTPVKIDGKLSGEVFSSDTLVVGKTGKINAQIDVESLVIHGEVSGNVKARDTIEVMQGATLSADVTTKKLIIHDAVFNGSCKMS